MLQQYVFEEMADISVAAMKNTLKSTQSLTFSHQSPKKAKKKTAEAGSNVFSMFEQSQIQEFKEVRRVWKLHLNNHFL